MNEERFFAPWPHGPKCGRKEKSGHSTQNDADRASPEIMGSESQRKASSLRCRPKGRRYNPESEAASRFAAESARGFEYLLFAGHRGVFERW